MRPPTLSLLADLTVALSVAAVLAGFVYFWL